ncbi:uncharacterized protein BT62DRAFT_241618 [Guyanagaster necrorhizus]|uniref:Uncharacterized protein n=1 Tax=Guyanagaster necrorhizus TaxID=856835 RepID=A0A9P7VQ47_9AGAR|nr:uncharacterized protein BT62DRAFT_241618 [Guyanagaster necrorhizus MCA 3950]KAG7444420.1 hypothetical protein BT62DRAFT_241618 [Guyanagaster necrorhizus MCA 3950]
MHVPGVRCIESTSDPFGIRSYRRMQRAVLNALLQSLLLSIFLVVFEYSSAILMTIRSIQALRIGGPWSIQRRRLIYVIFEQGMFYFCVVTLFTKAAVVLNFVAPAGFFQRPLNALTLPLSGLLTARFLLRLRAWEHKQSTLMTSSNQRTSSNQIPSIEFRVLSVIDEFGEDPVSVAERRQSEGENVLEVQRGTSTGYGENNE